MEEQKNKCPQLNYLKEFSFEKTAVLAGNMSTTEMIALKPVVENLGLDWSGQLKKLKREDPQNQLWTYQKAIAEDGKAYETVCMSPFNFQNWLFNLNESENLNIQLWTSYKKGLVIFLMSMLKVSLDEVTRLKHMEEDYRILKSMVTEYIQSNEEGKKYTQLAKGKFKESLTLQKDILDRMNNQNPNQLRLV